MLCYVMLLTSFVVLQIKESYTNKRHIWYAAVVAEVVTSWIHDRQVMGSNLKAFSGVDTIVVQHPS